MGTHVPHWITQCYLYTVTRQRWHYGVYRSQLKMVLDLNEKDLLQRAIHWKLRRFGHICRMEDNRKLKTLMFGIVDGTNKRGRPCREWMDDIVSWTTRAEQFGPSSQNMETHYKTSSGHQRALVPWFLKKKTRFSDRGGTQGWVSWLVAYRCGTPARKRSPIPALTGRT